MSVGLREPMTCQASSLLFFVGSDSIPNQAVRQAGLFTAERRGGIVGESRRQRVVFTATMNEGILFIGCLLRSLNFPGFLLVTLSGRGDKDINTVASALGVTL